MKIPSVHVDRSILYSLLFLLLAIIVSLYSYPRFCPYPFCSHPNPHREFIRCLDDWEMSDMIYTPRNPSYSSILNASLHNQRFASPSTPKPFIIVVPEHNLHVQGVVLCSRKHRILMRVRSGGHDFEGLSSTAPRPNQFVLVDLYKMNRTSINVGQRTAWVQPGATIGQLYYEISKASQTLAFPAGFCPTVGIGGHFSGGGFGALYRKYGLAADNVVDALLVDAEGQILNRETMGDDLFWAIRGGGGGSFGVVTMWKVNLVSVPQVVTTYITNRTLEENAANLVVQWQYVAPSLPDEMYCDVNIISIGKTIQATFVCIFLGGEDEFLNIFAQEFPELDVKREECSKGSYLRALLWYNGFQASLLQDVTTGKTPLTYRDPFEGKSEASLLQDVMTSRTPLTYRYPFKGKSDFITKPITLPQLEGMWKFLYQVEIKARFYLAPHGGIGDGVAEDALPYPHRKGNLYEIMYVIKWDKVGSNATYIKWMSDVYKYMTPYVSSNPRAAYVNYGDLDLGVNPRDGSPAGTYGYNYFKNNFKRLVEVKNKVDPTNFFWNEQSIPLKAPDGRSVK